MIWGVLWHRSQSSRESRIAYVLFMSVGRNYRMNIPSGLIQVPLQTIQAKDRPRIYHDVVVLNGCKALAEDRRHRKRGHVVHKDQSK
jgi:hypothetical protein